MADQTIELDAQDQRSDHQIRLRVVSGPHQGMSWVFDCPQQISIGRDSPSNLILRQEPALSRLHVKLDLDPPLAELIDQSSRNGTNVNGVRVARATLHDGDQFGIGQTEILFESFKSDLESNEPDVDGTRAVVTGLSNEMQHTGKSEIEPGRVDAPDGSIEITRLGVVARVGPQQTDLPVAEPEMTTCGDEGAGDQASFDLATDEAMDETQPLDDRLPKQGDSFGSYRLLDVLGRGGMAQVYRAQHRRTNEIVALKLIREDRLQADKHLPLFVRESALLSQLKHPRIVIAKEFGVEGRVPFLVMEYIETLDLLDLIDGQIGAQKLQTSIWVVSRVLQAVHYLHGQGIIHRDIKPSNILAFRQRHRLHIKLADFGLAKIFADAGYSGLTSEGSVRGTIAYMSPEQFHNSRGSGPADDLFACGACLFRFITGRLPNMVFRADETLKLLKNCEAADTIRPLIAKALHVRPAERYQHATEFASDLDSLSAR